MKPYTCPEHPFAEIKHTFDRTVTRIHLTGVTNEYDDNHQYFCSVCGLELSAEENEKLSS